MGFLHRIVRRVHCRGTHQRFAIDALPLIQSEAGRRMSRWFLYHYRSYLRGATDPDVRFRDFHNHVLHVRDGYWGGAPRVAHQWYDRLQKYLRAEKFDRAAHAAGVLTHYVTDVVQPFHTVSNERESVVHRPIEWSVGRSYDRIIRRWKQEELQVQIRLSRRPDWLGSLMMHTAQFAERHCDELAERYSLRQAIRSPRNALDEESLSRFAELFALAITSTARVLDRAADETEAYTGYPIPECGLGWATVGATLSAPTKMATRPWSQIAETLSVRSLANEYLRTGKLESRLPAEIDIKQRVVEVHRQEQLRKRRSAGETLRRRAA